MNYRQTVEPTAFGRYRLIELLGRGGMGEVWRAHDTTLDRVVAIKMLLPRYAQDPEFTERFRREARAVASLDDPHIVPIYDVGEIDGRLYVAMRLITGQDLQSVLNTGPMDPDRAVRIVEQIGSALHHAHSAGLVHRDVKPSNILLAENDFAYLIDFGIARSAGDAGLTSASAAVGTWAYMAPERFSNGDVAPSSDVYALACVLYQCLTGGVPFPGDTLEQVAGGHLSVPPPKPSAGSGTVPPALDDVIATGLAKAPMDRYPSTVDLAAAAQRAITRPIPRPDPAYAQAWSPAPATVVDSPTVVTRPRRRTGLVVAAVVGVVALVAGVVLFATTRSSDAPSEEVSAAPAPTETTQATPTPPPNTGPLTGVYRADYGPITHLDDKPGPDPAGAMDRYAFRSVCSATGCVATGSRIEGGTAFAAPFVLDRVGDSWLAVGLGSAPCKNNPSTETWEVLTVQPRPDGTLEGALSVATSNDCIAKRTIRLTRTGDVDLETLPDPAAVAPRVVSPAEALRGQYQQSRSFPSVGQTQQTLFRVRTDCLRTGDRCVSILHGAAGEIEPLVFADGKWNLLTVGDFQCRGAMMQVRKVGQFPLPQPPQNPITTLTGSGSQEQSQPCAGNVQFDETLTRVGD